MDTLLFIIKLIVMTLGTISLIFLSAVFLTIFISKTTNRRKGKTEDCTVDTIKSEEEKEEKKCSFNTNTFKPCDEELTPELVAVITAAVYASLGGTKYRVTAIRRIDKNKVPLWSYAGRREQMESMLN